MRKLLDILGLIILGVLAPIQIYLAYLGIELYLGQISALVIVIISLLFQAPIPIMLGAFLGAWHALGIHWIWSLLIIMPGVVFMSPHVIKDAIDRIKKK